MRHDEHYVEALAASASSPIGRLLPIDQLDPNPNQPRQVMGDLSELVASIAEKGIIEPIIVRRRQDRFQIIAGERRYQAAVQAGLSEVPVIIRDIDDDEVTEIALIENLQRKDLTPFEEAEALYPRRFFPREEFGTNVRQVYLEVKLWQAFALARTGRAAEAAAIASAFGGPAPGLDFTKDGMTGFVGAPRFQYYAGELQALLGNADAAREQWKRAAAGSDFRQAAFAYRAAQRLGAGDDAEWRPRLEAALAEAELYLFRGGHYPALATAARGLLLRALGHTREGDEALRQVFLLPDKGMPHHIARLALAEAQGVSTSRSTLTR
jgi:hypothetical protein